MNGICKDKSDEKHLIHHLLYQELMKIEHEWID